MLVMMIRMMMMILMRLGVVAGYDDMMIMMRLSVARS